jgi:O-antigen/teichoic acid export membrane protein
MILYLTFYIPLLNALELYRFSQTASIVIMVVKVALNTLLVLAYGFYGAAVGTVISYLFAAIIYEFYYRIKLKKMLGKQAAQIVPKPGAV